MEAGRRAAKRWTGKRKEAVKECIYMSLIVVCNSLSLGYSLLSIGGEMMILNG
jgi:hypothetical protein